MSNQFPRLLSPFTVGKLRIKNRIVMLPHGVEFAVDNLPSERHAYYYAERARGGVGLIVMEACGVHPTSKRRENVTIPYDRRGIPGFQRIADMVHEHDTKMLVQLVHCGRQINTVYSKLPLWAPSAIPCPRLREIPHAMDADEIKEVQRGFIQSATVVREGGMDGVEIHAGHGYLIQQFLSPWSNVRTDDYGGSLENRMRFLNEIVDGVRKEVGADFVVGIRISADELVPGGLTIDDMKEVCQRLDVSGKLDYISVSVGTNPTLWMGICDMNMPLGAMVPYASAIKRSVSVPVIAAVRINDPVQAEGILADGHADLIGMARELICEPEFVNKAREGRLEDIRKCVACLQECRRNEKIAAISCLQNPAVGYEKEMGLDTLKSSGRRKKVVVVGGGPAGLEAARVAALRGHDVTLYEKGNDLGGQVLIAAKVPNRQEFGDVVRYLTTQVRKLGVKIKLGVAADAKTVLAEKPDAVIVATGSTARMPAWPAATLPFVISVRDAILGTQPVGERIAVIDGGEASWQCCSAAEFLATQGKRVEVITSQYYVGLDIPTFSQRPLYERLAQAGVTLSPMTDLKEVRAGSLVCVKRFTGEESIKKVDTVVASFGGKAEDGLYGDLKGSVAELSLVGDCVAPRKAAEAIREGHQAARRL